MNDTATSTGNRSGARTSQAPGRRYGPGAPRARFTYRTTLYRMVGAAPDLAGLHHCPKDKAVR